VFLVLYCNFKLLTYYEIKIFGKKKTKKLGKWDVTRTRVNSDVGETQMYW